MAWRWITSAEVITYHACKLLSLMVNPSVASAEVIIYNGESASDPVALSIFLTTRDAQSFDFKDGLLLERGLFIGSFTNIAGVLVIWGPLKP